MLISSNKILDISFKFKLIKNLKICFISKLLLLHSNIQLYKQLNIRLRFVPKKLLKQTYRLVTIMIYAVLFRESEKFRRWTWITIITVLFVLQPSLTTYWLKVFKWVDIGNGISKVEMDIRTDWWSAVHFKWVFSLCKLWV